MKSLIVMVAVFLCVLFCFSASADSEWEEIHGNGVYTTSQYSASEKKAEKFAREITSQDLRALAQKTSKALDAALSIGAMNLRRHGYHADADWIRKEWTLRRYEIERLVSNPSRNIGDFEPISKYLAAAYEILELKLGYKLCHTLRLSDIKTINFSLTVVFRPCKYGLNEFQLHFVHDALYRGLLPVVSYWSSLITCSIATFGAGYFFVCSPAAMLVEFAMDRAVAPALAPKIYNLVCD